MRVLAVSGLRSSFLQHHAADRTLHAASGDDLHL